MQAISTSRTERSWSRLKWPAILWWAGIQMGVVLAPFTFSWSGLVVCLVLYLFVGLGVTMGYHRLLTHRSFKTPKVVEYLLSLLGTLSTQGGPLQWAATHRIHHQHSDTDDDPHSPKHGLWWAHIFWWMPFVPRQDDPVLSRRYVQDLARDPVHCFLDRFHIVPSILLAGLLYAVGQAYGGLGLSWVVWGIFVRTAFVYHATWLVNSAGHVWGYKTYATRDDSRNLWWVALVSLGEGWHNNHHAFPRSARHGLRWWEFDITWLSIQVLRLFGLAKHVQLPIKSRQPERATVPPDTEPTPVWTSSEADATAATLLRVAGLHEEKNPIPA